MTTVTTQRARRAHAEAVLAVKVAYAPGDSRRLELLRQCDAAALRIAQVERKAKSK
jgi:hypothetical protein